MTVLLVVFIWFFILANSLKILFQQTTKISNLA